ncbi:MAG: alpha/beta fold hydrolase [Pseudorhodobacter sp.]
MTGIVLIPGLLSDGTVWQAVAREFGSRTEIADLTQDTSIEAMAKGLLERNAGDIIAIGHSLGGRVAMEMARQAPARLRGLVLANTGHNGGTRAELPKRHARIAMGHDNMEKLADDWLPPMVAPARRQDAELMGTLRAMVLRHDADIHERQIHALIGRPDAAAYLPMITCPILLLAGTEDGWSPVAQHREIAAMAPDTTLEVIAGAGHFMPLEKPGETAVAIVNWLNRKGLAHGRQD